MSDQPDREIRRKSLSKTLLVNVMAVVFGFMLWTPLRLQLVKAFRSVVPDHLYTWVSEPGNLRLLLLFASVMYSVLLGIVYGRPSAIWFLIKLCIFPLYVVGKALLLVGGLSYWLYSSLRRLWKLLANPLTGLMLTVSNLVCYTVALSTESRFVITLAAVAAPVLSTLCVLWLYVWTFCPLDFLTPLAGLVERYLSSQSSQHRERAQELRESAHARKGPGPDSVAKHNRSVDMGLTPVEALYRVVERVHINTLLVNVFVFLFVFIGAQVCLSFGLCYLQIYQLDATSMDVGADAGLLVFVVLSLRTMFLNDFVHITAVASIVHVVLLIQSIVGIALFVVLVMSFSIISAARGESARKDFLGRIKEKIDEVKETKIRSIGAGRLLPKE